VKRDIALRLRREPLFFGCGAAVIVVSSALYLLSAQRDVAFWDTGEMQTVPWIFGIAHPTGFPAFVLLGWCFAHLVPFGSVAWRLGAFSALATGIATLALYTAAARITRVPALACTIALLFATSESVWEHATRAEVHALALCFSTVAFAALYGWSRSGSSARLLAGALAAGLALATHPVALWTLPGLGVLALAERRPSRRLAALAVMSCIIAALLPYTYLPLRSAAVFAARLDPTLSLGFDPGMPFWDYAHPALAANFWWLVSGQQFDKHDGFQAYVEPWRLVESARAFVAFEWHEIGPFALAALLGLVVMARRDRALTVAIVLFGFLGVPFALGYSLEADKVRYLLTAAWTVALLSAVGTAWIATAVAQHTSLREGRAVAALASIASLFIIFNAYRNRNILAINRDRVARTLVDDVTQHSSEDAIVVAPWIYATPLAYAAYVEHSFGKRIVVATGAEAISARIVNWSRLRCVLVVSDRPEVRIAGVTLSAPSTTRAPYVFAVAQPGSSSGDCGRRGR